MDYSDYLEIKEPEDNVKLTDRHSQIANLFYKLYELGFSQHLIETSINYTNSFDLNVLINFMTNHEFIRNKYLADESNNCEICKMHENEHANYFSLNFYSERMKSKSSMFTVENKSPGLGCQDYKEENKEEKCEICYDIREDKWTLPACGVHYFCLDCIKQYLETKISISQVQNIICPGENCLSKFSESEISSHLSTENFAKYKKFLERENLHRDPSVKFCIQPDCEGFIKSSNENPRSLCNKCRFEMCFKCGRAWHSGKTCDEANDLDYNRWALNKDVKECPNCKFKIEKNQGCDHMTCIICRYEFCWLCTGPWNLGHLEEQCMVVANNLNGNQQAEDVFDNNGMSPKTLLLIAALFPIWIPFVVLFSPTILSAIYVFEKQYETNKKKWLTTISASILAFILTPLIYTVILIVTPYILAKSVIDAH